MRAKKSLFLLTSRGAKHIASICYAKISYFVSGNIFIEATRLVDCHLAGMYDCHAAGFICL